MVNAINQIQPSLEFIPPDFNLGIFHACKLILPWYLKTQEAIDDVQTQNIETLAQLYEEFNQGKTRFLLAFRHPSTADPLCLSSVLWHILPKVAKTQGIKLKSPTHTHFMYDRGIPIWAGSVTGWLLPKLGATSIMRGKLDREGLKSARNLMTNGRFPLAAAPEGATNGHSEIISPLEPGLAQICFWCLEDLRKENRSEKVVILPIGIQYQYIDQPWTQLTTVLSQLEQDLAIENKTTSKIKIDKPEQAFNGHKDLYLRLLRVGEKLLSSMEEFYTQFYDRSLPAIPDYDDPNEKISARLSALLELALQVAEQHFQIQSKGSLIDRCRRLEQAGWNRIYREDYDNLSPVQHGLANWLASEADLYMKHMRIVENFSAVTGKYVKENPSAERFAETVMLIARLINMIKGEAKDDVPILGKKRVNITVGEPLSVSDKWDEYKKSRRQAVEFLTQDLQTSLESLILINYEYSKGQS
jgi:1-acyl-sn-glycerol-3-phosphate acyltransferase